MSTKKYGEGTLDMFFTQALLSKAGRPASLFPFFSHGTFLMERYATLMVQYLMCPL